MLSRVSQRSGVVLASSTSRVCVRSQVGAVASPGVAYRASRSAQHIVVSATRSITSSAALRNDGKQGAGSSGSGIPSQSDIEKLTAMLPGIDKVRHSTEAKEAMSGLLAALEKAGIDLKSGQPPSMMQMAKIAINSEVRQAAKKAIDALRDIGVDVTPEKITQIITGAGSGQAKDNGSKKE